MRPRRFLVILTLAILGGCASGTNSERTAHGSAGVQFPPYPAEPVIEWVATYATLSDVAFLEIRLNLDQVQIVLQAVQYPFICLKQN